MSYTARISKYAQRYIRSRASDLLTDTCRVTRNRVYDLDENNTYRPMAGEVIYEGPCRLWELNTGMAVSVGEESMAITNTMLSFPWDIDPIPLLEDFVEMLTSPDPATMGKSFVLGEPAKGGNLRGTRRYAVKTEDSTREEW